jgi:AraC-like DNA-binding protein
MTQGILDKVLASLEVEVRAFALCRVATGWRLTTDPLPKLVLHYILEGSGTLRTGSGREFMFRRGSVVIVPPGARQSIGGEGAEIELPHERGLSMRDDGVAVVEAGFGDAEIVFACGTVSATCAGGLGLFAHLREPTVVDLTSYEFIEPAFKFLLAEIAQPTVGSQALVEALMRQCLVLVLRQHLRRCDVCSPLLECLQDRRLARVVSHVLEHPSGPHTVASLAALAGMSRAAFAQRFLRVFTRTPMAFVQTVRLQLGARLLANTDFPVKLIAGTLGYASRAYFSTAFRRTYGVDPSTYRAQGERNHQPAEAQQRAEPDSASFRTVSIHPAMGRRGPQTSVVG